MQTFASLRVLLIVFLLCLPHFQVKAQVGNCEEAQSSAVLEAGNIRARIYNDGTLFWKGGQNLYEAPKNGGVNSIFTTTFIVGGLIDGDLRMAGSTYGNYEFWPGPLDEQGAPPADCSAYDQIWEISSTDFETYEADSVFTENMENWPWHLGAPVVDGDGDPDNYNLAGGDRPELLGDQTHWWIMNDRGNEHNFSETKPIGLEVHGSSFAFNNPGVAGEVTFYRYRLFYRNTLPLTDAYIGIYSDFDLGNASDDYIGSDSLLHLMYGYNSDNLDENGYEDKPPALGYTFLITPEAQVDGLDNDYDGDIDESGEQAGMYAATYHQGGGGVVGDPSNASEMYTYLRALWVDGEPFTFGGDARTYSNQVTRYVFTGDPETGTYWTELQPGRNGELAPNPGADRRFVLSSGPFTLLPGEETEVLFAIVWAQGTNYLNSVTKIKGITASLQDTPSALLVSGYQPGQLQETPPESPNVLGFDQNFPNPFTDFTTLRYSLPKTMEVRLSVYNILGQEIEVLSEGSQEAGVYAIDFDGSALPAGIYFARIELDHLSFTKKLVRLDY